MAKFKAILIEKEEAGQKVNLVDFDEANLMEGDVTIAVEWSTVNYKDGLAITGKAPVVRKFPMIPGIDLAGTVETSSHPGWKPGDKVVLNGCGLSETIFGGYAQKARVKGDLLVAIPAGMSTREAMAIGTAGYTAMLCVMALERYGIRPAQGPIIVTGAAGGVGSVAIALLAKLGYTVIASTGRLSEADYLKSLGASEIVDRNQFTGPAKPMDQERFAGGVDSVGSTTLANLIAMTKYGGAIAACGLAGGRNRFSPMSATLAPRGLATARARLRQDQARCDHARSGVRGPDGSGQGHPGWEIARPHGRAYRQRLTKYRPVCPTLSRIIRDAPPMRVLRVLPLLALLTAAPAAAQQILTGEEARSFVAGKLFAYSCFDGTRGAGRIFADGSVAGNIRFVGSDVLRYLRLPENTLYVRGDQVCATLRGLPFEPCFTVTRTSSHSFRGAFANFGLSFMYCDFTREGRMLLARRRGIQRRTSGPVSSPPPTAP